MQSTEIKTRTKIKSTYYVKWAWESMVFALTITSNSISNSTHLALTIASLFPLLFHTLDSAMCENHSVRLLSALVRTKAHLAFARHVLSIGNKNTYSMNGLSIYVHFHRLWLRAFVCLVYIFALSVDVGFFSLSPSPLIWYSVLSLLLLPSLLLLFFYPYHFILFG